MVPALGAAWFPFRSLSARRLNIPAAVPRNINILSRIALGDKKINRTKRTRSDCSDPQESSMCSQSFFYYYFFLILRYWFEPDDASGEILETYSERRVPIGRIASVSRGHLPLAHALRFPSPLLYFNLSANGVTVSKSISSPHRLCFLLTTL